jgi:hypothetical protein
MEDGFFIQLPSNGDFERHPENTLTQYTTHLARRIELEGTGWRVAVAEFSFPHNYIKLSKGHEGILKISKNPFTRVIFPQYTQSTYEYKTLILFINLYLENRFGKDNPVKLDLNQDEGGDLVRVLLKPDCEVIIQDRLAFLLGFDGVRNEHLKQTQEAPSFPKEQLEKQNENWFMDIRRGTKESYDVTLNIKEGYYSDPQSTLKEINMKLVRAWLKMT